VAFDLYPFSVVVLNFVQNIVTIYILHCKNPFHLICYVSLIGVVSVDSQRPEDGLIKFETHVKISSA
jgi:hypothetical protein